MVEDNTILLVTAMILTTVLPYTVLTLVIILTARSIRKLLQDKTIVRYRQELGFHDTSSITTKTTMTEDSDKP